MSIRSCVICAWISTGISEEELLKEDWKSFKTCKPHTKEPKMAVCAKCQSQDLEFREGVGKTTGKPWKGWFCKPCKLMHGMNGVPWGDRSAPKNAPTAFKTQNSSLPQPVSNLEKKVDQILSILKANFPPISVENEEVPF